MASEEKKESPRRERSSLAVFLGMVMSALVSLFIAGTMFTVGAIHRKMADDRARRALIHFLAVEATDIHAESCKSAYGLFVGNRHREVAALQMAGARSLDKALALDADPKLVATLRSIYGRLNRITRDLKSANEFYQARKKLTQGQIARAIDECSGMGKELDRVLKIAAEEGVDEAALAELGKTRAEAAKLAEALAKQKEKLLPDVQLSTYSIDIGRKLGHFVPYIKISNFSNAPVTITRLSSTWKELRLVLTHEKSKTLIPQEVAPEIKPDEAVVCQAWMSKLNDVLPAGHFEGAITIETDCPGYEKFTVPVKGIVERVKPMPNAISGMRVRGEATAKVRVQSYTDALVTIKSATCSIPGAEVTLPEGNQVAPKKRTEVLVKFPAGVLPVGPFEATLTIETDYPRHLPLTIPIKGTVLKE